MSVRAAFAAQAEVCTRMGSPFTARLCRLVAERLGPGTPVAERVLGWRGDPGGRADALPLRLMGALHGLVIEEIDAGLAAVYPPHDQGLSDDTVWDAVSAALAAHPRFITARLRRPPQTNETMRSAALCPGFLTIIARTELPLITSELGASAGLNQIWNRFCYRFGDAAWGPEDSPVRLVPEWQGPPPPLVPVRLLERAGCDTAPPDLAKPADCLRLLSYVWADQPERLARMQAALALAGEAGVQIITRDAIDWLSDRLALRLQGAAHVIYHSIFWQYLDPSAQAAAVERLSEAGRRATREAPLAWLRLEADGESPGAAILLTLWPDGETRRLGRADFHGRWVHWTGWA